MEVESPPNILITGITGFFGRNFCDYLIQKNPLINIIGTAHSESKLAYFKKTFPQIPTLVIDLASEKFEEMIEDIIRKHHITHIVHSAAMKHVDICQENPLMAYLVNAKGSDTLVRVAKRNNVRNLIALSTDKTNNPCNTYGLVKYVMQENVLANGYSVYQGANFFWSDGSVLDVWFNQHVRGRSLSVRNPDHIRYFNTIDHVCERIYLNLDTKKAVILPDHVYVIRLGDLLDAFREYFNHPDTTSFPQYSYEKDVEVLRDEVEVKIPLTKDELIEKIRIFHQNML
jgi:UDP-N-acetylglucosamine 4,6-dehydratase/5-epimerase